MKKPTLVVVNSNYPNEKNRYGDVFVHSRLKHYTRYFDIQVAGWKKKLPDHEFEYEGIRVTMVNKSGKLIRAIQSFKPDVLGFHFVEGWMYKAIIRPFNGPCFIWIHGGESLGWYRRLFQFNLRNPVPFLRYVARNTLQMFQMHQLFGYANRNPEKVRLIFISKWMRMIAEADTRSSIKYPEYIPNPIDAGRFAYREKSDDQRCRILLIRSFDSKKYANDQATEAISLLRHKPFFPKLSFTLYGVGKYWKQLTDPIAGLPNVTLKNEFLENRNIPAVHEQHGIFLCPTRQDAQGVSMCEAMCSGLAVITSDNTAIPEFVSHRHSGWLTHSAEEIAAAIEHLYTHPEIYHFISETGAREIRQKSSTEAVVSKEVSLIEKALKIFQTS